MNSSYMPKGFSLNRRFILTVIGVIVLLVGIFIFCLEHYMPSQGEQMGEPTMIDTSTVNEAMDALNHEAELKNESRLSENQGNHQDVRFEAPEDWQAEEVLQKNQEEYPEREYSRPTRHKQIAYPSTYSPRATRMEEAVSPSSALTVKADVSTALSLNEVQTSFRDTAKMLNDAVEREEAVIHATLLAPMTPFEVKAGNIIPAILQTAIISDLPGTIVAKVRRDVFDSVSGKHLLIPQGTTLIGTYDSQIATGQARILMAWSRLIFPNGDSINLKGQPGTDAMGASGLRDKVDNHYSKLFGASFMYSLITAGTRLTNGNVKVEDMTPQQAMTESIAQQMGQTSAGLMEKNMSIQPTLTIREGTLFNVLLTKDLVLPHAYERG